MTHTHNEPTHPSPINQARCNKETQSPIARPQPTTLILNPLQSPPTITASIKATKPCLCSGSTPSPANSKIPPYSHTLMTHLSAPIMTKASVHNTHSHTTLKKKNDSMADDLQMQVALKKKKQDLKKKQWAKEKCADEEREKSLIIKKQKKIRAWSQSPPPTTMMT